MLDENLSEKTQTTFVIKELPHIADHKYFIQMNDFEKRILGMSFISFLIIIASIMI